LRNIQGFRRRGRGAVNAGRFEPAWDAGMGSQKRREMEPDDLLCSRNARLKKALVERAQWKINQPPSLKR
jgi:hypothetical protein